MGKKLPDRPQWFKDMVGHLRAERSSGNASPSEFLEHAADEIESRHKGGDPYLRSLAITDVAAYDRLVAKEQRDRAQDEATIAEATRWIQPGMLADDVLIKLGLDTEIELGFGRSVKTLDATPDERLKAIAQLKQKLDNAKNGMQKQIDALERAHEMASEKTLREVIADPEDYGRHAGAR